MKKLLCWLLVLLLPFAGMFVAQGLMPARKPNWTLNSDHLINVLGCVEDGQTLLVRELFSTGLEYLLGLDTETGSERFRIPLAAKFLQPKSGTILEAALTPDENYVVFRVMETNRRDTQYVVFYDWKQKKVTKVIQTPDGVVSLGVRPGDFLVRNDHFYLFNFSQTEIVKSVALEMSTSHAQLSPSSNMVSFENINGFVPELQLYDLRGKKFSTAISAWLHDIQWAEDEQSFTCIGLDAIKNSLVKYHFIRKEDDFVVDSTKDHSFQVTGNVLPDQHFTAIATTVKRYTWRAQMDREIGGLATVLLDRFWPNAQVLLLYDRQSSELKHKLTLPIGHKALTSFNMNTHPSGKSVALWMGQYIQYWDLYPASRWYPLLGLLLGTLLAVVVGWKVLKVRAKKPVPGTP